MKKAYMKPEVAVTHVVTRYHLCQGSIDTSKPTNLDDDLLEGGDNPADFSRRGRSVWDDEEEEY